MLMPTAWPLFVWFYLGALLAAVAPDRLRGPLLLPVPVVSALCLWLGEPTWESLWLLDFELQPWRQDRLSLLFGWLFHLASFLGLLFSLHLRDRGQQVAMLLYMGSALGAVFAGDLLSLFVHWEMLALSSVFLIWARGSERAYRAGLRYLLVQVASAMLLLAGSLLVLRDRGSLAFGYIGLDGLGSWLIFFAFGIKAGFPLLHTWLTDAYPEATPTGTVILSAFTTKVAIYALVRGYPGTQLLVYIGALMTCFPIFYAVIENDLRRVLAYSLINQLGFMVCGVGIGTPLALNGTVSHAFAHVIYKGLLFMAMGAVLVQTGKIKGSELGGLYKTMPKTAGLCIVGAASISAFPLFSGFVSKSMIISALLQQYEQGQVVYQWVWLVLLFASAGVFHHAGIKVPYFAFYAHDSGIRASEPRWNMLLAMTLAALLCVLIGCYPQWLYSLLPWSLDYDPYTVSHVLSQLQLLFFAALAFAWLNQAGIYPPEQRGVNLDADWAWRHWLRQRLSRLEQQVWPGWIGWQRRWRRRLQRLIVHSARRHGLSRRGRRVLDPAVGQHGFGRLLGRKPTSDMLMWVALLLLVFVVLSNI